MRRIVGNGHKDIPSVADLHERRAFGKVARIARLDHVPGARPAHGDVIIRRVNDEIGRLRRAVELIVTARDHEITPVFLVKVHHIVAHAERVDTAVDKPIDVIELMDAVILPIIAPCIVIVCFGNIGKGQQIVGKLQCVVIIICERGVVRPEKAHVQPMLFFVIIREYVAVLLARRGEVVERLILRLFKSDDGVKQNVRAFAADSKAHLTPFVQGERDLKMFSDGIARLQCALIDAFPVRIHRHCCRRRAFGAFEIAVQRPRPLLRDAVHAHRFRRGRGEHLLAAHAGSAALPRFICIGHGLVLPAIAIEIVPAVVTLFLRKRIPVAGARRQARLLRIRLLPRSAVKRSIIECLGRIVLFACTHKAHSLQ